MRILAKNVCFAHPCGWTAQVNVFRFHDDNVIRWSFVSARALRETWDRVPSGSLNDFYDWMHSSVENFVNHVRQCA